MRARGAAPAAASSVETSDRNALFVTPSPTPADTATEHTPESKAVPSGTPSASTQSTTEQRQRARSWRRDYSRRLFFTDLLALVWVVFGAQIAWFGLGNVDIAVRNDARVEPISYWIFSAVLVLLWMWALSLRDTRGERVVGTGAAEYVGIAHASIALFGIVAIIAFLTQIDIARGYLLLGLPVGILTLIATRWLWRQWLIVQRSQGLYSANVLLVGSRSSVTALARELNRTPSAGYRVVGACIPTGAVADTIEGTDIPIIGRVDDVKAAMLASGADTVAVTSTDDLPADKVKQISWSLEAGKQHLVLAPSITDIAGPRLRTRPVAGLPLIHVETPRFSKGQRFAKRSMDLVASVLGVIVLSPLLAIVALCVRFSSPGPVLFRQQRVGLRGHEFTMLKFRSMRADAEKVLADLQRERAELGADSGNEVMFKMKNDPRVTSVGRFIRRFSIDELPQLFNVVGGSMSLVGPRPPLLSEVEQYAEHVHRRFLVKPGITGLWQVSGRSTLSWEDTVRLDLSYVENWSLLGDVAILARTAKAAVAPGESAH